MSNDSITDRDILQLWEEDENFALSLKELTRQYLANTVMQIPDPETVGYFKLLWKIFDLNVDSYIWSTDEYQQWRISKSDIEKFVTLFQRDKAENTHYGSKEELLNNMRLWVSSGPSAVRAPFINETVCELLEKTVDACLSGLDDREAEILSLRYGISTNGFEMKPADIARKFQVSPSRIGQIHNKALRRLKHPSRSQFLRMFIEPLTMSLVNNAGQLLDEFPYSDAFLGSRGLDLLSGLDDDLIVKLNACYVRTAHDLFSNKRTFAQWVPHGFTASEFHAIAQAMDAYDPRGYLESPLRDEYQEVQDGRVIEQRRILDMSLSEFGVTRKKCESIIKHIFGGRYGVTVRDMVLEPESSYLRSSVPAVGPGWITIINEKLELYGLRIGMDKSEL